MTGATAGATDGLVPAVGGTRLVPSPDPIARDYILLGLRLDQRIPGLVDGYFGPANLKTQVDTEQLRPPARLRDDAAALRARLGAEVDAPDRRAWLDAQLVALETHAAHLAGESLPYLDHVERCFDHAPPRRPEAEFERAAEALDSLLPGDAPLTERLDAWDAQFDIPPDRLEGLARWLTDRLRARASSLFGLPDGEDLRISLVTGQPWSAYNWYDGGRRSRVDINTDLPNRVPELVNLIAHEAYPGHHLEQAWKETDLVDRAGRLESSILLINTPECLISEGLANLGRIFAVDDDEHAGLLVELFGRAGLPIADSANDAREAAERSIALARHRRALSAIRGNAAILRHADGWSHEAVLDYLRDVGRYSTAVATRRIAFLEHPLWRTYVFVYAEGERLLATWLERATEPERPVRFARLLHEQLTPAAVRAPG
jgi:hypothetical protein